MDIATANLDELKTHREAINQRIKELERATLEEVEAKAHSLGFTLVKNGAYPPGKSKVAIKYRNPENPSETWSGRGRKPVWLMQMINEGKEIEDFRIN